MGLFYFPNSIASYPVILESLVSILVEINRSTKIVNIKMLYCPTDALNYINCGLLKTR